MFETVEDIKKNNNVRSVIVCSLVPGIFCAGMLGGFLFLLFKICLCFTWHMECNMDVNSVIISRLDDSPNCTLLSLRS